MADFIEDQTGAFVFLILLASCCTWCCLAHCLFIPCCTCLKRRHKLDETCLVTGPDEPLSFLSAHRGGSAEGMENTIGAFRHANKVGMNLMELDVQLSKDGHPVVAHDSDLGRMCGPEYQNKLISDYNYADLPEIQRKVTMHLTEGDFEM